MARILKHLSTRVRSFRGASEGHIAIIFGLVSTVLIVSAGAGIDLMRAYQARQKISQIATLACQYASRPSVLRMASPTYSTANGAPTYSGSVNDYINKALVTQKLPWGQTNGAPFTYTPSGPADVDLSLSVPTTLTRIINVREIAVAGHAHCYDTPVATQPSPFVAKEGFEAAGNPTVDRGSYAFHTPGQRPLGSPTSATGSTPVYTGNDGTAWYGTGYCLETDSVGTNSSTVPEGTHSAELDCDTGSGVSGNSAISSRAYLAAGNYELRYNFRGRISYANYVPAYLCGSAASDLSWANDRNSFGGGVSNALRTNQINVYFDRTTSATVSPPPLHWTIDGTQQLAGSNLIDMCVDSLTWVERSVRITVTTADSYWLTFAADGQNDSYGGQLDNIRLCFDTCPGTLQDDFPAVWLAANNGGVNKVLFRDTFDNPSYTQDPYISFNRTKGGNLANSLGTTGTAQSGWPSQAASGWATGPYNEVNVWLQDAYQGSQYISMQGWNGYSTGTDTLNRLISRKFLLDPGYYSVSYNYLSMIDFNAPSGIWGTYCYSTPGSGPPYSSATSPLSGRARYTSTNATITAGTNILGVFMSHGQLVSTLNPNTAMGNAANGSSTPTTTGGQATYTNPDGTVTATPTVPPDKVNWASYDASVNNPVIDTCGYAASYVWVPRTAAVKITKPGWYWLTFSSQGDEVYGTGNGAAIDDVKLTALGSPYMAYPPGNATTIPAPGPQPGSRIYFDGFYIIADPFQPPAPLQ